MIKVRNGINVVTEVKSSDNKNIRSMVELDLELKPGTQPISQRFRDLNPELEKNCRISSTSGWRKG